MKTTVTTLYIQRRDGRDLETVDEFNSWKEASAMVAEYQLADPSAYYYISRRSCRIGHVEYLSKTDHVECRILDNWS